METRKEIWRINGKPNAYVLEVKRRRKRKGRYIDVWRAEAWFTSAKQAALFAMNLKARSIINLGEGSVIEAITKATNMVVDMFKAQNALCEFAIEWAEGVVGDVDPEDIPDGAMDEEAHDEEDE